MTGPGGHGDQETRAALSGRVLAIELDQGDRRALVRSHPEVRDMDTVVVVAAAGRPARGLGAALAELAEQLSHGEHLRTEHLVNAMLSPGAVPSPAELAEAGRQARFRERLIAEFGAYTAAQLADRAGSKARNRAHLAHSWWTRGRVFRVEHQGAQWYLGFQFDEQAQPLPSITAVLTSLAGWDGWEVARWLVTANPLLGQLRPLELLVKDPEDVARAAAFAGRRARGVHNPETSGHGAETIAT